MAVVNWGIIGPGNIAANFAQGLAECKSGQLVSIASRDAERRKTFGEKFGVADQATHGSYDALIADPNVDAIYVATPHPFHATFGLQVLRGGKHLLVEKPAGLIAGEVVALAEAAAQMGVLFAEGLMYRSHPQVARVLELVQSQAIGPLRHIEASFGFAAGFDPKSRLFDPALGGGAILDVGLYPVSIVRLLAGAAAGTGPVDPVQVAGSGSLVSTGVDEIAHLTLVFPGGLTATCSTAVTLNMANTVTLHGANGTIQMLDPWVPGRDAGPSKAEIIITRDGKPTSETHGDTRMLFAYEAEVVSQAILNGQTQLESPAPNWADSIGTMRVVDAWRSQAGYVLPGETVEGLRRLEGVLPASLPKIPTLRIDGSDRDVSCLVLGCDNKDTLAEGAIVWDAWWEAGGNAFDTGFVYGGGHHEAVLGQWMATRGVAKQANVIVKGAHSPYNVPDAIEVELDISLDRLGLDHAPFYILHRDNMDVPVGEFVGALNDLQRRGKIGAFGGSNWTAARLAEANGYAASNGLRPFTILNNNLSLAVMERPIWPGCISGNTPETLSYLRETGVAHVSWSSSARGYFLDPDLRTALPKGTNPEDTFVSAANEERRARALILAEERGVTAHNIATAWVLRQSFPSFAVIGPRSAGEIATALPALNVGLTPDECAWLNLEQQTRP